MIERARAFTAGATIGSLPMIWYAVLDTGGLNLRASHVFGFLTLGLILLPGRTPAIDGRTLALGVLMAGLIVFGATGNLAWFGTGYWRLSEVFRFLTNVAIGLGVTVAFLEGIRRAPAQLLLGLLITTAAAMVWWVLALAGTPIGLGGLVSAFARGDTRAVLFDAHLPAIRSLHGDQVLLGARHGAVFGFLTAAAVAHIVLARHEFGPTARRLARATTGFAALLAVVSLSRSAMLALALGGLVWLYVKRDELLWNPAVYAATALTLVAALSTLASGLGERLFSDTDSLTSRGDNASEVLAAEWTLLGSPRLPEGTDSPHNMLIEFAAAGGIPMLLAGVLIVAVVIVGVLTAPRRSPAVTMLAIVVLVRLLSAARGSLDTAAVIALLLFVGLDASWPSPSSWHRYLSPGRQVTVPPAEGMRARTS